MISKGRQREVHTAALQLLSEIAQDDTEPVDVFTAIRDIGVWLIFQPLPNLLGVTLRQGAGGIMVTTERSANIQRYTAAHELGHWLLHRFDATWDTDETVLGHATTAREQEAQLFASYFLMPRRLVRRVLNRYGVTTGADLTPLTLYQVSRDLHVSYEAAAMHLTNLRILTRWQQAELRQARPIDLKTQLNNGLRPANPLADVWPLDIGSEPLIVTADDEVSIWLPERATAGYRWETQVSGDALQVVQDAPTPPPGNGRPRAIERGPAPRAGGVGGRQIVLRAENAGAWDVDLALRRSFSPAEPVDALNFTGWVQEKPAIANSPHLLQQLGAA
ncbi:ImmA/IrrE family metallo-endopeptidase [Leifsonia sp. NPDC102414]|uniref:ImmA/IrrE family metallo-endopeptidase n=1 Tax=Leifsonia sp. NPDC102414 TaxID=3364124 RepID=UPI00380D6564